MKRCTFYFLLVVFVLSCTDDRDKGTLEELSDWMTGSFSSAEQAENDSSFFDIRLHMVRIWSKRTDGRWLYIEQAAADYLDQPYRQRIYHLTQNNDTTFVSSVFELNDPMRFAGKWKAPEVFAQLSVDSLSEREGCSIVLRKKADSYVGSTIDKKCISSLRGAAYATSEVVIRSDQMTSWDRGFDENDQQVWGAVKGAYIFKKTADY